MCLHLGLYFVLNRLAHQDHLFGLIRDDGSTFELRDIKEHFLRNVSSLRGLRDVVSLEVLECFGDLQNSTFLIEVFV